MAAAGAIVVAWGGQAVALAATVAGAVVGRGDAVADRRVRLAAGATVINSGKGAGFSAMTYTPKIMIPVTIGVKSIKTTPTASPEAVGLPAVRRFMLLRPRPGGRTKPIQVSRPSRHIQPDPPWPAERSTKLGRRPGGR